MMMRIVPSDIEALSRVAGGHKGYAAARTRQRPRRPTGAKSSIALFLASSIGSTFSGVA